jgi:hypothetical protein
MTLAEPIVEPIVAQDNPWIKEYSHLEHLDDFVQLFMDLYAQEQDDLWGWADATVAYSLRFRGALKQLASSVPRSLKTLESYRHTALTFPPDQRILDIQFSIHRIAAYTDHPQEWLQRAADNQWSAKQLKEAIILETGRISLRCAYRVAYCLKMKKTLMDGRSQCALCQERCQTVSEESLS